VELFPTACKIRYINCKSVSERFEAESHGKLIGSNARPIPVKPAFNHWLCLQFQIRKCLLCIFVQISLSNSANFLARCKTKILVYYPNHFGYTFCGNFSYCLQKTIYKLQIVFKSLWDGNSWKIDREQFETNHRKRSSS